MGDSRAVIYVIGGQQGEGFEGIRLTFPYYCPPLKKRGKINQDFARRRLGGSKLSQG